MLEIAERRARPKAERFLTSLTGRTCLLDHFPLRRGGYWATFTESLRDKSPHRTILALKLTRMGSCRTATEEP